MIRGHYQPPATFDAPRFRGASALELPLADRHGGMATAIYTHDSPDAPWRLQRIEEWLLPASPYELVHRLDDDWPLDPLDESGRRDIAAINARRAQEWAEHDARVMGDAL